jgi:hypothetical protein
MDGARARRHTPLPARSKRATAISQGELTAAAP